MRVAITRFALPTNAGVHVDPGLFMTDDALLDGYKCAIGEAEISRNEVTPIPAWANPGILPSSELC